MWEASDTQRSSARPEAVWALWSNAARWPSWNEQLKSAELDGALAVGASAKVKFKKGGQMAFTVLECEPGSRFLSESRLIACRFGHEHRLEPAGAGVEISHRLYLSGPLSGLFATLWGRKKLRHSVSRFIERERELAE